MALIDRIPSKEHPLGIKRTFSARYQDNEKLKRRCKAKSFEYLTRKYFQFKDDGKHLEVTFVNNGGVCPTYITSLFVRRCNFDNKGEIFFVLNNSSDGITFGLGGSPDGCKILDPEHKIKNPEKYKLSGCSGCTNEFVHTKNRVRFLDNTKGIQLWGTVPIKLPRIPIEEYKRHDNGRFNYMLTILPSLDSSFSYRDANGIENYAQNRD